VTRRLAAAATAALFVFGALAAVPAPAGAAAAPTPAPAGGPSDLLVTFAYAATNGAPVSDDGRVRRIAPLPGESIDAAAARWDAQAGVLAVLPDVQLFPTDVPVDPLWPNQWDLAPLTPESRGSANVAPVWDLTTGSPDVVVAVLDTGRIDHPDLVDAMPTGWGVDMVTSTISSVDGDARDTDPTDPGDSCGGNPSSWHGTHVAGTIAAQQNGIGVAGIAPSVKIMHVRVLGYCGGGLDDVIDGIRWAAGLPTNYYGAPWSTFGLPTNEHRADVINMSLGGIAPCDAAMSAAIASARAVGTVVVAAAGNNNVNASSFTPANCPGAITVAAVGRAGARAYYSNYGAGVDIAAPGGDASRDTAVYSTVGIGPTTLTGYGYASYQGTSMAAPHVAGVAALVRSVHPTWSAAQVESALLSGVRPFPADTRPDPRPCLAPGDPATTGGQLCGAGLLDASLALGLQPHSVRISAPATLPIGASSAVSAASDAGLPVTLAVDPASAERCSISGLTLTGTGGGDCIVVATALGDATHPTARSTATVRILGSSHYIVAGVGASANILTFGDAPKAIVGYSSSAGLPLTYTSESPETCTFSGAVVTTVSAGTCAFTVGSPGNLAYSDAEPLAVTLPVYRAPQRISFSLPSSMRIDAAPPALVATSSAGLFVTLSTTTSNVCRPDWTGSGFELAIVGPGVCRIRSSQGGDANRLPAADVEAAMNVIPLVAIAQREFSIFLAAGPSFVGDSFRIGYGGGSTSSTPTFRSTTPKACTVSGRTVRLVGTGTCTVRGTKPGDLFYAGAVSVASISVYARARSVTPPSIWQSGATLIGRPGTWVLGAPRATLAYQWYRCSTPARSSCAPISGATRPTLAVADDLRGAYVQLWVTATQRGISSVTAGSGILRVWGR